MIVADVAFSRAAARICATSGDNVIAAGVGAGATVSMTMAGFSCVFSMAGGTSFAC